MKHIKKIDKPKKKRRKKKKDEENLKKSNDSAVIDETESVVTPAEPEVDLYIDKYSVEKNSELEEILQECGVDVIGDITYIETVDNIDVYTLVSVEPLLENIYLYFFSDGTLALVDYEKVELYNTGTYYLEVDDFIFDEEEKQEVRDTVIYATTNIFKAEKVEFIEDGKDIVYEIKDYKMGYELTTGKVRVYKFNGNYTDKTFYYHENAPDGSNGIDYDNWD